MTTEHGGDRGIVIGGSARVSGQIASGDSVTQNQQVNTTVGTEAAVALDRVEQLLDQYGERLPEGARARRDLEDVRRELAETDPDEERIAGAMERLGRRVAGVAVLAEAVGAALGALGFR
ncbi:hypothetical protein [Actinomadura rugatobispora]|uniref:DUF3618 domain-containing protein n=1 Tax=Actinomadura rugatobispora TaxID=1994 RepID=A0ABW0ZX36_9ACTN|nr:hypothetical protein GCM10010200_050800 [Actinomadura rugatobispora]